MKMRSFATAGAAFVALGVVGAAPATAATITFDYEAGVTGTARLEPDAVPLIPMVEMMFDLEPGTIPAEAEFAESFSGSFSVPDDPEQITDSDITVDLPLLAGIFGYTPESSVVDILEDFGIMPSNVFLDAFDTLGITSVDSAVDVLDELFDVSFVGAGTLSTDTETTTFNIEYFSTTNSLLIDGFDADIASLCLTEACNAAAAVDYSVDLILDELVELDELLDLSALLDFDLSSAVSLSRSFVGDELTVAGKLGLVGTTTPVPTPTPLAARPASQTAPTPTAPVAAVAQESESVPEPTAVLGLLGIGAWFLKRLSLKGRLAREEK
jgi:hypothetical protein